MLPESHPPPPTEHELLLGFVCGSREPVKGPDFVCRSGLYWASERLDHERH